MRIIRTNKVSFLSGDGIVTEPDGGTRFYQAHRGTLNASLDSAMSLNVETHPAGDNVSNRTSYDEEDKVDFLRMQDSKSQDNEACSLQ